MEQNIKDKIDEILTFSNQDISQENANLNGRSSAGMQNLVSGTVLKDYALDMLDDDVRKAFRTGEIHIHDFDHYALGTTTCTQIRLDEVLKGGFVTDKCPLTEAQSITVAVAHAAIAIQANQNQQHGGQAFPNWDFDLAPYVDKSYFKNLDKLKKLDVKDNLETKAMEMTEEETQQAMQAFVHNMNSMNGSRGAQPVFSSLNFGLDTSWQGRMITRCTLKAQMAGLGDGHTPIFPILIFKLKEGINFTEGEPNYDLYRLGLECLSKRLFPNFQFVDSTFNVNTTSDDPRDTIATMGCRTRVFEDVNGKSTPVGRGNASFTTLNLPMIAMGSNGYEDFLTNVLHYTNMSIRQLQKRFDFQKTKLVGNFEFLYTQGSFDNKDYDTALNTYLGERLNSTSLSVGYIGLAEALMILTGKHHGECDKARAMGLEIIRTMRARLDEEKYNTKLNYSLLATPSEGLAGTSMRKFVKKYGYVEGITDNNFFTNSNHVPVWYNISAKKKIEIEAPYHELTNAGHIAYVEVDGAVSNNLDALDDIVKYMAKCNMGYGSINVPVDKCTSCGYDDDVIETTCPICGSGDINRIRRITGYLVGSMEKWNTGKRDEERKRVKHNIL